jgi:hypothetical protein
MTGVNQITEGQTTTYSVPPVSGNTTYNWYFDIGGVITGQNVKGWKIISNFGNMIFVKAGTEGVSVVCEITSTCLDVKSFKYVTVFPNNNDPCDPFLSFSSNPMEKTSAVNRVSVIDDEPCGPTETTFFRSESKTTNKEKKSKKISPKNYTIEIYSIYNKKVFSQTQKSNKFNIPELKKGVYIVKFPNNKKTITKRLIIK